MTDSIDTSEREAEEPRGPFNLPIREMRAEPVPHQPADPLRAALQLALEATPEQLPTALGALAAQPAAERVPFDPLAEFGFMLEQRRDVWVVVDDCGGTTPASLTERVMWDAIVKSRGITATSGKESGNG